jgi:hypothetical protein
LAIPDQANRAQAAKKTPATQSDMPDMYPEARGCART